MAPHSPLGLSRFPLVMFVSVAICSDCVSFPDEPFPDILAVTGYDPNRTPKPVVVLDRDVNLPAADLPDQSVLYTPSMSEPVAVPVFRHLVELGCVKTGEPYFLPGNANPVAVGDISFPGEVWMSFAPASTAHRFRRAALSSLARVLPEQSPESKVQPRHDDEEDDQRFCHSRTRLSFVFGGYSSQGLPWKFGEPSFLNYRHGETASPPG